MTPDETSPSPVDEHLLAEMMACDALLHASATRAGWRTRTSSRLRDRRRTTAARSRLLLLLTMLDATERREARARRGADHGRNDPQAKSSAPGPVRRPRATSAPGGFGFVVRARATACWAARSP